MKKRDIPLVAVLALQIILAVIVFWPDAAASGGETTPLLGDLTSDAVVSLLIEDNTGGSLTLHKSAGSWVLPDSGDYPVDAERVVALLDKVVAIDTGRLVTRTEASHRRLQVAWEQFLRRLTIETADGDELILYLGSSASYGSSHVRLDGQPETYLASDLSSWEANTSPTSWIDTSYISLSGEELQAITVANAQGEFRLEKDAEGEWGLVGLTAGEELDTAAVSTLVSRASTVNMTVPLGVAEEDGYGLSNPSAVITLEMADRTLTWQVGAFDPEDSSYVVKSAESPYYVRVSQYSASDLVDKGRQDLILLPTPESTGS